MEPMVKAMRGMLAPSGTMADSGGALLALDRFRLCAHRKWVLPPADGAGIVEVAV